MSARLKDTIEGLTGEARTDVEVTWTDVEHFAAETTPWLEQLASSEDKELAACAGIALSLLNQTVDSVRARTAGAFRALRCIDGEVQSNG
jgi:hypothetical protein